MELLTIIVTLVVLIFNFAQSKIEHEHEKKTGKKFGTHKGVDHWRVLIVFGLGAAILYKYAGLHSFYFYGGVITAVYDPVMALLVGKNPWYKGRTAWTDRAYRTVSKWTGINLFYLWIIQLFSGIISASHYFWPQYLRNVELRAIVEVIALPVGAYLIYQLIWFIIRKIRK